VIYAGVDLAGENLLGDGVKIRENTTVGRQTIIGSNCTVQNGAVIGDRVRIVDLSHITFDCEIGDDSFISVGVYTMNDNSMSRGGEVVGPKIGKRTRVGGGAMFLPGVKVGDDAIVGAGAVVTHDVPNGGKVMGVPARDATLPKRKPSPGAFGGWGDEDLVEEFFGHRQVPIG
jgi:acetyltransferase-like isoleucine patch superfamily enzyme